LSLDNEKIGQYFERHSEFKLPRYLRERDIIEEYFGVGNNSIFFKHSNLFEQIIHVSM
jgi:hypothetical protein